MNDKELDKLIKEKIHENEVIDERINDLFEMYKEKYRNEKSTEKKMKNNIKSFVQKMKYVAAILMMGIFFGTGGMTYAHINGTETLISPLLRSIGINSKYEENAIEINKEIVDENNVKITLNNVAIDESVCIVAYDVDWPNVKVDEYIDLSGEFKINNINIKPINRFVKILSENKCMCYHIYDFSEIELVENEENIEFLSNINLLVKYNKEQYELGSITYDNELESQWNFKEIIPVKNIEKNTSYEIDSNLIEFDGYKIKATELVKSSYTNMIRIKTDKKDHTLLEDTYVLTEKFVIKDSLGNQIAIDAEQREYDDIVYTNRIFIENIDMNDILTIEVYAKKDGVQDGKLYTKVEKVGELKIDLSKAKEKEKIQEEYKKFSNEEYSFEYDSKWSIYGKLTKDDVGYLVDPTNMFRINTESTTNDEYGLTITLDIEEGKLEDYIDSYIQSLDTTYTSCENKEKIVINGEEGYKLLIAFEDIYIWEYIFEKNEKIYSISISGSELELSNQNESIERFIETFNVR